MSGRRLCTSKNHPQGEYTCRCGQRHANAFKRRRRSEPRRRPNRRLLLFHTRKRAFAVPARRQEFDLPGADHLSAGGIGASIEVPTLDGKETLEIPPGTATGEVFTLRGRGMPDIRTQNRGNLLVQVHIDVPKKFTKDHEELLRQLAEMENTNVTPKRKNFIEKLKEYFHT